MPGAHEVEDRPRARERAFVKEPDPVEVNPEGALGDFLLLAQVEEILAELLVAELIRGAVVVARQLADRFEITLLGFGGQPPQRQVFEHAASEWGHDYPPVRVK